MEEVEVMDCPDCAGCGQVADDEAMTPWVHRAEGVLGPLLCPRCGGTGKILKEEED